MQLDTYFYATEMSCSMKNRPEVLYKQAKVALDFLGKVGLYKNSGRQVQWTMEQFLKSSWTTSNKMSVECIEIVGLTVAM